MRKYVIFTDACADLTPEMYAELGVRTIQLDILMEGEAPIANDQVDIKEIYAKLRAKQGASPPRLILQKTPGAVWPRAILSILI